MDRAHDPVQIGGVGHPAARLAFVEAAIIDELDVEPAERGGRLEHLALDAAGAIPARLAARRRVERKDQPAATARRSAAANAPQLAQKGIDIGRDLAGLPVAGQMTLITAHWRDNILAT